MKDEKMKDEKVKEKDSRLILSFILPPSSFPKE